jgi:hypothetical protein
MGLPNVKNKNLELPPGFGFRQGFYLGDKKMTITELERELKNTPLISGSFVIGWLIYDRQGKSYKLPLGTSYQEAVRLAKRLLS